MNKKTFHKKWYFLALLIAFCIFLAFFLYIGIWTILYEDDMPFMGVAIIMAIGVVYWLIKRYLIS